MVEIQHHAAVVFEFDLSQAPVVVPCALRLFWPLTWFTYEYMRFKEKRTHRSVHRPPFFVVPRVGANAVSEVIFSTKPLSMVNAGENPRATGRFSRRQRDV